MLKASRHFTLKAWDCSIFSAAPMCLSMHKIRLAVDIISECRSNLQITTRKDIQIVPKRVVVTVSVLYASCTVRCTVVAVLLALWSSDHLFHLYVGYVVFRYLLTPSDNYVNDY